MCRRETAFVLFLSLKCQINQRNKCNALQRFKAMNIVMAVCVKSGHRASQSGAEAASHSRLTHCFLPAPFSSCREKINLLITLPHNIVRYVTNVPLAFSGRRAHCQSRGIWPGTPTLPSRSGLLGPGRSCSYRSLCMVGTATPTRNNENEMSHTYNAYIHRTQYMFANLPDSAEHLGPLPHSGYEDTARRTDP